MASVELLNLCKSFAGLGVIHDVSIDIAEGEFVALVGPSGCGKSTLLRMIAGLESITSGELRIGGRLVNTVPPKERDIAMVFQNYALYPHMTVAENMGFSMRLRGASKADILAAVSKAATMLELDQLLGRKPKELSGGQRQRVAMGRAVVRDPKAFLFDEPLSNLDAKLRVAMRAEIKGLHQRLGTTMVYVTHDQVEAMTMADTIVVLRAGRVEQIGKPLDLYDKPDNVFIAGFIGSPAMNLLEGQLIRLDGKVVFETADGLTFPLPPRYSDHAIDVPVLYGIRPEHIGIGPTGARADVVLVEATGAEAHLMTRVGHQGMSCLLHDRVRVARGETIHLRPSLDHVHLFDAATTHRL